jgi:hypothetical protein
MIGGLMIIALPITVIGNNFSTVYRESLAADAAMGRTKPKIGRYS